MNAALKARWANIFTTLVAMITIFQTSLLPTAPFPEQSLIVIGIVATYLAMGLTAWKQYLSPDVNNTAVKMTVGIAIATTIAGLLELTPILNLSPKTEEYYKWGISLVVTAINILSKQLFPSFDQKQKMSELKKS
ncbi:MAG: hypothetical protein V4560_14865 [Bacteroidota bacterium]